MKQESNIDDVWNPLSVRSGSLRKGAAAKRVLCAGKRTRRPEIARGVGFRMVFAGGLVAMECQELDTRLSLWS